MLPPHLYTREGLERGLTVAAVSRAVERTKTLTERGVFPLLSLGHLAQVTGASYDYLRELVARRRDPYEEFSMPKRSGGTRQIAAPEPMLMDVQRWILDHILISVPTSGSSFAYRRGISIVDCASQHRGARWLLKLDLHSFFDSIGERSVYRVFKELGYDKLVSFELARITTRAETATSAPWRAHRSTIPSYSVTQQGRLPQGAPSSGALANAAAGPLDESLIEYATKHRLVYTRYSDDLTFSSATDFERENAVQHLRALGALIRAGGFTVHNSKTRIVPPGARRIVLGLLVDDTVRLMPEHIRRIENHLRGAEKFGLANHAAFRGFDSAISFVNHLDGWIAFGLGVERARAEQWRERLSRLVPTAAKGSVQKLTE